MEKTQKLSAKIIKISVIFVLVLLSVFFFILAFISKQNPQDSLLYVNNISRNVDYKVYLNNNSFITQEYLEKNEMYISDLVKNIEANFKYTFNTSKKQNISYNYEIIAKIEGEYKESSEESASKIWDKSYVLVEKKSFELTDSTAFNIEENVNIDYVLYNNEVSEFRRALKLPLNAKLIVQMNVEVNSVNNGNKNLEESSSLKMNIPLNQLAFKIADEYDPVTNNSVTTGEKFNINYKYLGLGVIVLLIDICMVLLIPSFRKLIFNKNVNKFRVHIDKILKQYSGIIVETLNTVELNNKNLINIKNLEEMIDLEEELRIPILFSEVEKDKEAWFIIIQDENVYRYILKDSDVV